jgi:hypothetical protein
MLIFLNILSFLLALRVFNFCSFLFSSPFLLLFPFLFCSSRPCFSFFLSIFCRVVHWVCSGSEAVDLAILMARTYTNAFDVLAIRNAYHGVECK